MAQRNLFPASDAAFARGYAYEPDFLAAAEEEALIGAIERLPLKQAEYKSFLAHLRIVSYGNIGYAYFMVMMQAFNGAGDTITPTIVNFFGFWLFEIPLAYVLAMPLKMKSNGVFFSIAIAESAMAAASAILFSRGKWKKQKI